MEEMLSKIAKPSMIQISIDTSILIGLLDTEDIWHRQAVTLHSALEQHRLSVAVFDCVLAETISTLSRRIKERRRSLTINQVVERILADYPPDNAIFWVFSDVPELYNEIIELTRSSGGELNFNDALIALSCRDRNIPLIASFDRDFDRLSWLKRVERAEDLSDIL